MHYSDLAMPVVGNHFTHHIVNMSLKYREENKAINCLTGKATSVRVYEWAMFLKLSAKI